MDQWLKKASERAGADRRRNSIRHIQRCLNRQWDGIVAWHRDRGIWPGCGAEGHVSHIADDRLSSRPKAWRQQGVHQMVRRRALRANGGSKASWQPVQLPDVACVW